MLVVHSRTRVDLNFRLGMALSPSQQRRRSCAAGNHLGFSSAPPWNTSVSTVRVSERGVSGIARDHTYFCRNVI